MNNREEIEELLSETNGIQKVTQKYINNFNAEYGENCGKNLISIQTNQILNV